jgi:hypothetical protein
MKIPFIHKKRNSLVLHYCAFTVEALSISLSIITQCLFLHSCTIVKIKNKNKTKTPKTKTPKENTEKNPIIFSP